MIHRDGKIQVQKDLELYYQSWHPATVTKAVVVLVHGFGEHSGRYPHLVDAMVREGFAVYIFDQRGHGRSGGQRGHVNHWGEYNQDVHTFVQWVKSQEPGQLVFLHGHSMGALTALDYPLHYPNTVDGLVIEGGPFEPVGVGSPLLIAIANFLSHLWPACPLPLYIDPKALSRNPQVGEAYQTDPLVHGKTSARWGTEAMEVVERVKQRAAEIQKPILLIHGQADRLNTAEGSRKYFEALTCPDKTLQIYPDNYHELHNDLNHEQVMQDLVEWLSQHLNGHGRSEQ